MTQAEIWQMLVPQKTPNPGEPPRNRSVEERKRKADHKRAEGRRQSAEEDLDSRGKRREE
jgi:hypothetical protein